MIRGGRGVDVLPAETRESNGTMKSSNTWSRIPRSIMVAVVWLVYPAIHVFLLPFNEAASCGKCDDGGDAYVRSYLIS